MKPVYRYSAECVRVIDGDTIDVILDFGFSLKQKMRIRLAGIDTPELRSKDEEERNWAKLAKEFAQDCLFGLDGKSRPLVVETVKTRAGKERQTFGRYVAVVYMLDREDMLDGEPKESDWFCLNERLVEESLAERSSG